MIYTQTLRFSVDLIFSLAELVLSGVFSCMLRQISQNTNVFGGLSNTDFVFSKQKKSAVSRVKNNKSFPATEIQVESIWFPGIPIFVNVYIDTYLYTASYLFMNS